MMPRPVDVEAAVVAFLASALAATVGTSRPAVTSWPLEGVLVRVQVVDGGPARAVVLDDAVLSVEVWAADSVAAANVASQACGLLDAGQGSGGVLVYAASASRPRSVPDPVTQSPRYLFTVSVTARRI